MEENFIIRIEVYDNYIYAINSDNEEIKIELDYDSEMKKFTVTESKTGDDFSKLTWLKTLKEIEKYLEVNFYNVMLFNIDKLKFENWKSRMMLALQVKANDIK